MRIRDSRAVRFCRLLWKSIGDAGTFDVAYQLGFCALFAIFPFAIFLLTLIGYVPLHGLDKELLDLVYRFMPGQAARLCDHVIHEIVSRQRGWLLVTALAGALYCQYQMFISPDTVSGIGVSLQIVFAAVVGGALLSL